MEQTVLIPIDASKELPEKEGKYPVTFDHSDDFDVLYYDPKKKKFLDRDGFGGLMDMGQPEYWWKKVLVSDLPNLFPEMMKEELPSESKINWQIITKVKQKRELGYSVREIICYKDGMADIIKWIKDYLTQRKEEGEEPKEPKYHIEWDGDQYCCYSSEFGKYACYGLAITPEGALNDFMNNAEDFRKLLKRKEQ